jgi:hypothetical protein
LPLTYSGTSANVVKVAGANEASAQGITLGPSSACWKCLLKRERTSARLASLMKMTCLLCKMMADSVVVFVSGVCKSVLPCCTGVVSRLLSKSHVVPCPDALVWFQL